MLGRDAVAPPPAGRFVAVALTSALVLADDWDVAPAYHVLGCALDAAGEAKCWSVVSREDVVPAAAVGSPVELAEPPPGPFLQIALSSSAACALRVSGELVCWPLVDGWTSVEAPAGRFAAVHGVQPDYPSHDPSSFCALRPDRTLHCWPETVPTVDDPEAVPHGAFAGLGGHCALHVDGGVRCWGRFTR